MAKIGYSKSPRRRRSYSGADGGRLFSDWITSNNSADAELYGSLPTLRSRCRALERENPYFARWLAELEANVLGDKGIRLTMDVRTKRGQKDRRASRLIEDAWDQFSKRGEFTACRQFDRLSWARIALRSIARDGDCLVELVRGYDRNSYSFAVQSWEADHVDCKYNEDNIRMGVESDDWGQPTAYHVWRRHPGDNLLGYVGSSDKRRRIVAENGERTSGSSALLPFVKRRFSQSRGEPWGSVAIRQLHQLGSYEEAALVSARVGASKMGFLFEAGDEVGGADSFQQRRTMTAEPGAIEVIPVGEPGEVQFQSWDPNDPHGDMPGFVKTMLRGVASGLSASYNIISNDLEGVSFSSIRAGTLSERELWKLMQHWWIEAVEKPVFCAWLDWAVATGAIPLPYSEINRWMAPIMEGRRWDYVNPLQDIQAIEKAIELGLTSRQRENRKRGQTFAEVVDEVAEDNALAESQGVAFASGDPEPEQMPMPEADE